MSALQLKRTSPDACTIVCKNCGKGKELHSDEFRKLPRPFKVRCGCGHVAQLDLNRRHFPRSPWCQDIFAKVPSNLSLA